MKLFCLLPLWASTLLMAQSAAEQLEGLAARLPYFCAQNFFFDQPGCWGDREPEYQQLTAELAAIRAPAGLLRHSDPKVRTLAIAALFAQEEPQLLPAIAALAGDAAQTFRTVLPDARPFFPGVERKPFFQDQTVGQVAEQALRAYLEPYLLPQDFPGIYSVNPDCTFTATIFLPAPTNFPATFSGILADDGSETRDLFVDPPGIVVHGIGRKQNPGECTNRDLSGTYLVELEGSTLQADTTRVAFLALGQIVADRAGNFEGRLGSNYGGLPLKGEDISGTYTVASNCVFQLKYYTAGEGRAPEDGVTLKGSFIDKGMGAYLMVLEPSTATVLGILRRQ